MIDQFLYQLEVINQALKALDSQLEDMKSLNDDLFRMNALINIRRKLYDSRLLIEVVKRRDIKPLKCPICSIALNEDEYKNHLEVHKIIREKGY